MYKMKHLRHLALALGLLSLANLALAHGPTRQKVTETIEINAPASEVWAVMGNFQTADTWLPMVTASEGEGGNDKGATRTLVLSPEASLHEVLKKHSDEKMSYSYKIPNSTLDVSILPVNNYSSTISVKDSDSGSIVTWKGAFYRGYPNNDPPPELNEEAAIAAVTGVYKAGLSALKEIVESK